VLLPVNAGWLLGLASLVKRFASRKLKALEGNQPNGSFLRAYGPTTYDITSGL
jgi:hypothetical protein